MKFMMSSAVIGWVLAWTFSIPLVHFTLSIVLRLWCIPRSSVMIIRAFFMVSKQYCVVAHELIHCSKPWYCCWGRRTFTTVRYRHNFCSSASIFSCH